MPVNHCRTTWLISFQKRKTTLGVGIEGFTGWPNVDILFQIPKTEELAINGILSPIQRMLFTVIIIFK